jgi:nucleoside-diphosphate-sugar epimerase
MRVFVTGATGYIGSAVTRRLVAAGHAVVALAREPDRVVAIRALGAEAVLGRLRHELATLASGCDAVIHCAVDHDGDAAGLDSRALDGLLSARGAHMVYTSGVLVLGKAGSTPSLEDSPTHRAHPAVSWRPGHERRVLVSRGAVIRPGYVFGGSNGITGGWFASARADGAARYVGDGSNHLAMVNLADLAEFYRLVVENKASGVFHAVDDGHATILELATAASDAAGSGRVHSVPVAEARRTEGALADAKTLDQWVAGPRARALGWTPGPPFVERADAVFAEWKAANKAKK